MRNVFDVKGKVVIITGGTGLIGSVLAKAFRDAGAKVVPADIDAKNPHSYHLDIASEVSVLDLIRYADKKFKKVDTWINCAYPRTSDWPAKLEEIKISSWRKNVDMHLNGYFLCCQKIAQYMKKQGFGSIINFASIYGIVAPDFSIYKGTDLTMPAAYSAIKAGIINFTKYLALYYGKCNIRANCISPGGVYNKQPKAFVKNYEAATALGRMARPDDIIGGAIYLSSDASKYVTGHNLVIDGGWTAK